MPRPLENSAEAAIGFDYAAVDEALGEKEAGGDSPSAHLRAVDTLEFGRHLVSYIRAQSNARLTVDCLYLALGDAELEGVSMTEIGERYGRSKAAISKRIKKIRRDLHLPPNRNLKSPHACATYARTNRNPIRLDRAS